MVLMVVQGEGFDTVFKSRDVKPQWQRWFIALATVSAGCSVGVGSMVSAELKVVGGKHAGQVIPLNRRKFLIGREQDCQLRPNSEMVSRHHCVFSIDDFSVRIRDLGSTNGTLVNGERIRRETVLASGDRILIGNLDFELVVRPGVAVPEADSKALPTATSLNSDTQTSSPTVLDVPGSAPPTAGAQTVTLPLSDIAAVSATTPPAVGATAVPASTVAAAPPQPDLASLAAAMQPQFPYPPMMPPMGYPGAMYPGYPYQQPMMPGYGQMYPQMMPPMGYPMQPQGMPTPPAPSPSQAAATIEVSLPDPAATGAKESEAPKGSTGAAPKDTAKPTGAADAIIKQYMGRRPGTPG
jgi:predicted component of type VI protein secretion system